MYGATRTAGAAAALAERAGAAGGVPGARPCAEAAAVRRVPPSLSYPLCSLTPRVSRCARAQTQGAGDAAADDRRGATDVL